MSGRDVVVANHAEFNRRAMWGYRAPERAAWDRGGWALQDQALYWGRGEVLVLVPTRPEEVFLEDASRARGGRRVEAVAVPGKGVFPSRDAAASEEVTGLVAGWLSGGGRLISWGVTPGFYSLVERLKALGCSFECPETPAPEFYQRALWLDSKVGGRLFLGACGVPVPAGRLAAGIVEAARAALWFAEKRGSGAVVKANYAAGGFGVRVFSPEEVLSRPDFVERDLSVRARYDGCWRSRLLVVEELAGGEEWRKTLPLTTDWIVLPDGGVRHMGSGLMTVKHRSRYEGVMAGVGVLSGSLRARCEALGARIAERLSTEGYRGWFDADMVASVDGSLLVNEINLRRSCPAYAFELARLRWGDSWERAGCVATCDRVAVGRDFSEGYCSVRALVDRFNARGASRGVSAVVAGATGSLASPSPFAGVAVFGPECEAVSLGLAELRGLLRGEGGPL